MEAFEKIVGQAKELGADDVKRITSKQIVVQEWVRHKCLYGCLFSGKRFTCPPYSPTPEETKRIVESYSLGLILRFQSKKVGKEGEFELNKLTQEAMYELEKFAFLNGYYKAISFPFGACRVCDDCPAEKENNESYANRSKCKNPRKARPPMESCGIDVFATAKNAGFEPSILIEKTPVLAYCLILLE